MPNAGILLAAAMALSPADAGTLDASPSGTTVDDDDDVAMMSDDRDDEVETTLHVLANPNDEQADASARTPTGVPRRSVNLAGGGGADNACDCGAVGAKRPPDGGHGPSALVVAIAAGLTFFARRRRID